MAIDRSPKRRRLTPESERSSSPDELTTTTPFDSAKKSYPVKMPVAKYSYAIEDESPDELENDVHAFYRGRRKAHQNTASKQASVSRQDGKLMQQAADGDEMMAENGDDRGIEDNGEEEEGAEDDDDDDQSMHTPPSHLDSTTPEPEPEPQPPELSPQDKWRSWKLQRTLEGHRRGVAQVKISPDGIKIASCSADATIKIWETSTGKLLHTLEGHLAGVSTIAWSPDSETLASGSDDKSIRLWNTETGKPYMTPLIGHHNYVYSIAFSPKGNMIVSGSYDEAVFLWDVRGARVMRSLPAHSDPVGGVDFVRDGTLIVSCAGDGLIRIWDTATGQCLRTLVQEERAPVTSVVFSPNGKYILAWTLDSCLRLWDYVEGRCVKTYQGHTNSKYSIGGGFGVYGEEQTDVFVSTGSEDGSIVFWDITTKEILQSIDAHDGVVLGLDDLFAKGLMVSGGIDGKVKVWELEQPTIQSSQDELNDTMEAV